MTAPVLDIDEGVPQYVTLGRDEATDTRISFRAAGLHHYLLSFPPGSSITASTLSEGDGREGREAIRTALNELVAAGYVKRAKTQDRRGRWSTRMRVYATPQPVDNPVPAKTKRQPPKPGTGFRAPVPPAETSATGDGFPGVGNPGVGSLGAKDLSQDLRTKDLKPKDQNRSARARDADSPPADNPDEMIDMVVFEIEQRTQVKIPPGHAELVALQILGRASSPVGKPVPFVRAAIKREEDPRNFLPTYTPPTAKTWQQKGTDAQFDRAMARARLRESTTDQRCAQAQSLKGKFKPYQNPEDDSEYELDFWGQPVPGTPTYERAHRDDPVPVGAILQDLPVIQGHAEPVSTHPRGGAADPLTSQKYGPGSTKL